MKSSRIFVACLMMVSFSMLSCQYQYYCRHNGDCKELSKTRSDVGEFCIDNVCNATQECGDCGADNQICNFSTKECEEICSDENKCEGKCVDLKNDNDNCGKCKNSCKNGQYCVNGQCVCPDGWGDCNNDPSDGCETDLYSHENCGECGIQCNVDKEVCFYGDCLPCYDGYMSCYNSCVNIKNDPVNCGKCDARCDGSCSNGTCWMICGSEGYIDITNDAKHCGSCDIDCGNKICENGGCTDECIDGYSLINNKCVDMTELHIQGEELCVDGYGNCNGNWEDGCEVALNSKEYCGSCENKCEDKYCIYKEDHNSYECSENCEGINYKLCDVECVDLTQDSDHCGDCNSQCKLVDNASVECKNGECVYTCKDGYVTCKEESNIRCVKSDENNCGACGIKCVDNKVCLGNSCECGENYGNCEGKCVAHMQDCKNCQEGWFNLNDDWGDGCEFNSSESSIKLECNNNIKTCDIELVSSTNCSAGKSEIEGNCIDNNAIIYITSADDFLNESRKYNERQNKAMNSDRPDVSGKSNACNNSEQFCEDKYYILTNDIDLTTLKPDEPIYFKNFYHHFHGMYHKITYNLAQSCGRGSSVHSVLECGLFNVFTSFQNSDSENSDPAESVIEKLNVNVKLNKSIQNYSPIGGLVGHFDGINDSTMIKNVKCNFENNGNNEIQTTNLGGCIGKMTGGNIDNMTCTGTVKNSSISKFSFTGGCIGQIVNGDNSATINNLNCGEQGEELKVNYNVNYNYETSYQDICIGSVTGNNMSSPILNKITKSCYGICGSKKYCNGECTKECTSSMNYNEN